MSDNEIILRPVDEKPALTMESHLTAAVVSDQWQVISFFESCRIVAVNHLWGNFKFEVIGEGFISTKAFLNTKHFLAMRSLFRVNKGIALSGSGTGENFL
jgi:hypothetical protein